MNEEVFTKILAPLPGDKPCGEDIRYSDEVTALKAMRIEETPANMNLGAWKKKESESDWNKVADIAANLLATKSKDLNLLNIYVDALIRANGYVGYEAGIELYFHFLEAFWDQVHPVIEEGNDFSSRFAPIKGLDKNVIVPFKFLDISTQKLDPLGKFTLHYYIFNVAAKEKIKDAPKNSQEFLKTFNVLPHEKLEELEGFATRVIEKIKAIEDFIISKILPEQQEEYQDVNFSTTIETLAILQKMAKDALAGVASAQQAAEAQNEPDASGAPAGAGGGSGGGSFNAAAMNFNASAMNFNASASLASKDQAYEIIEKAVTFLLEYEPHAPAPYLMKRALEWRKKSMYELVVDMVPDQNTSQFLVGLLGLKQENVEGEGPPPDEEGGGPYGGGGMPGGGAPARSGGNPFDRGY